MAFTDAQKQTAHRSVQILGGSPLDRLGDFYAAIEQSPRSAEFRKARNTLDNERSKLRALERELAVYSDADDADPVLDDIRTKIEHQRERCDEALTAYVGVEATEEDRDRVSVAAYRAEFSEVVQIAFDYFEHVQGQCELLHAIQKRYRRPHREHGFCEPKFCTAVARAPQARQCLNWIASTLGIKSASGTPPAPLTPPALPEPPADYHEALAAAHDARDALEKARTAYKAEQQRLAEREADQPGFAVDLDHAACRRLDALQEAVRQAENARGRAQAEVGIEWENYISSISPLTKQFSHDVLADDLRIARAALDLLPLTHQKIASLRGAEPHPSPETMTWLRARADIGQLRSLWMLRNGGAA